MKLSSELHGHADGRPSLVLLHGLTFDRRHWQPVLRELATIDPRRQVLAVDLPGHGGSAVWDRYDLAEVVDALHATVTDAGLGPPVVVGHSIGGVLATSYAATHPARAVVNLDQPLLPGTFGDLIREVEPVLRGPSYLQVWRRLLDGMHLERLPAPARELIQAAPTPSAELLLGYWNEILTSSNNAITAHRTGEVAALHARGTAYRYVAGEQPPAKYRQWLVSALPDVAITVLPGSGHFPHLTHPGEIARLATAETQ